MNRPGLGTLDRPRALPLSKWYGGTPSAVIVVLGQTQLWMRQGTYRIARVRADFWLTGGVYNARPALVASCLSS